MIIFESAKNLDFFYYLCRQNVQNNGYKDSRIYIKCPNGINVPTGHKAGVCLHWSLKRWKVESYQYVDKPQEIGKDKSDTR